MHFFFTFHYPHLYWFRKSHLPKKYEIEILEIKMRKKTKSNFFETKVSLEGRDECRPFIIILKKIYTTGFTLSCCNKND